MNQIPITFVESAPRVVPISPRCDFLTLDAVRSILGLSAGQVLAHVEDGKLLWAFNLAASSNGRNALLRFWVPSVREPKAVEGMTMAEVVAVLVGRRDFFTRGDLAIRWVISRDTIMQLVRGQLKEAGGRISRESVAEFLARRWVGVS